MVWIKGLNPLNLVALVLMSHSSLCVELIVYVYMYIEGR